MGDFAVLINSGVSKTKAVGLNFLVSLSSFVGCYIAVAVGQDFADSSIYILPFAAGLFLYLSLACILPELLGQHLHATPHTSEQCKNEVTVLDQETGKKAASNSGHKPAHKHSLLQQVLIVLYVIVGAGLMAVVALAAPHSHGEEGGGHEGHSH